MAESTAAESTAAGSYVSSRLTKGTVSLDELQTLLRAWQPGESIAAFGARVRQQGILTKQTAQRTTDVVDLLRVWLFTPDATPAHRLKMLIERGADRQTLAQLYFLYKARTERVLYDFAVQAYWPASHEGALYLRTEKIDHFLRQGVDAGAVAQPWSPQTRERLARGILRALIDAGLVDKGATGNHEYLAVSPSDFVIAYLAYDLHGRGLSDGALVAHPDWQLWGLAGTAVVDVLDHLDARAGLLLQRGGGLVSITWQHATMEG